MILVLNPQGTAARLKGGAVVPRVIGEDRPQLLIREPRMAGEGSQGLDLGPTDGTRRLATFAFAGLGGDDIEPAVRRQEVIEELRRVLVNLTLGPAGELDEQEVADKRRDVISAPRPWIEIGIAQVQAQARLETTPDPRLTSPRAPD